MRVSKRDICIERKCKQKSALKHFALKAVKEGGGSSAKLERVQNY